MHLTTDPHVVALAEYCVAITGPFNLVGLILEQSDGTLRIGRVAASLKT
jgi:hypothetical protein